MRNHHDNLAHDLADFRMRSGDIVAERLDLCGWGSAGIVDVASVRPSRTRPVPTCYEVKVSRADFLADVRAEKWRKYVPFFERVYFACEAGLVAPKEVPDGAGLVCRHSSGWKTARAPRFRRADGSLEHEQRVAQVLLAILMNHHPAPWRAPTRAERLRVLSVTVEEERWKTLRSRYLLVRDPSTIPRIAVEAADAERGEG